MNTLDTVNKWRLLKDEDTDYDIKKKKIRPLNKENAAMATVLLILLLLTAYSFLAMNNTGVNVAKGMKDTFSNFFLMFSEPYSHRFTIWNALLEVSMTVIMP